MNMFTTLFCTLSQLARIQWQFSSENNFIFIFGRWGVVPKLGFSVPISTFPLMSRAYWRYRSHVGSSVSYSSLSRNIKTVATFKQRPWKQDCVQYVTVELCRILVWIVPKKPEDRADFWNEALRAPSRSRTVSLVATERTAHTDERVRVSGTNLAGGGGNYTVDWDASVVQVPRASFYRSSSLVSRRRRHRRRLISK